MHLERLELREKLVLSGYGDRHVQLGTADMKANSISRQAKIELAKLVSALERSGAFSKSVARRT